MAVNPETPYASAVANGVAVFFSFSFTVLDDGDLMVTGTTGGVTTAYVLGVDYSVTGLGVNPGSINFVTAPSNGIVITMFRLSALGREIQYQTLGDLLSGTLNEDLDRIWYALQEIRARADGSLRFPYPEPAAELPSAANRANKVLAFDSAGAPVLSIPTSGTAAALALLLADPTLPSNGAGLSGFDRTLNYAVNTIGWGVRTSDTLPNLLLYIPVSEWAAILNGTSVTDLTSYIQTAINTGRRFFVPRGKWPISATTRLVFPVSGGGLDGAGPNHSILWALPGTGGTSAQLANYTAGSCLCRAINPAGANSYEVLLHFSNIAVILNHPTASITTTAIQVGVDMRHCGRFLLDNVWVGNYAPANSFVTKANPPNGFAQQGYGILTGSFDSGNIAYCGGEVANIRNCFVYGAYKCISMDDATLAPLSASHGINVIGCDIQGGHHLLVQEQQYTAGITWRDNTVQNAVKQNGDASPSYVMRIAGRDSTVHGGYVEAGGVDHILKFESASEGNRVTMAHYGSTAIGIEAFRDLGRRNRVACAVDTGTNPGGVDSRGIPIVRYDRSFEEMHATAHWTGAVMTLDNGFGLTVTRPAGVGDYLFTYLLPVLDFNALDFVVAYDTNASGHGGTYAVLSRTLSNVRIQFYAQNGATTTAIDPRFVMVRVKQRVTA